MVAILLISFFTSILLGAKTIDILKKRKVRQTVREEGLKSHLKKTGTPTMGGIFVILTVFLISLFAMLTEIVQIEQRSRYILILLTTIGFGIIGFLDDFLKVEASNTDGLSPKGKIFLLTLVSLIYSIISVYVIGVDTKLLIPFYKMVEVPKLLYILLSVIVMLSVTNAINLTDGVDGLSTSVGVVIMTFFVILGLKMLNVEIVSFLMITIGAFLGFLLYNWNKAKVFMGDTGSFFLGGVIGIVSLELFAPLFLLLICIIPILVTLSVIIQVFWFKKTGKRVFKMAPLHHHFEHKGWSEIKIVAVFTLITLAALIVSVSAINI